MPLLPRRALFFLNVLTLTPALLAMAAPYVPASQWWAPSVAALAYPWTLAPLLLWGAFWLRTHRKYGFIHLGLLALNYGLLGHHIQFNGPAEVRQTDVRLLTLNAQNFGALAPNRKMLLARLEDERPDIFCVQEYAEQLRGSQTPTSRLIAEEFGLKEYRFLPYQPGGRFGLAVFSRFPVVRSGLVGGAGRAMYADLALYDDTLRVYNLHLESYKLRSQTRYGLGLSQPPEGVRVKSKRLSPRESWAVARGLLKVWRRQETGVAAFRRHLGRCKHRAVVCGDLNHPPGTHIYRQVRAGGDSAFGERGSGMPKTYGAGLFSFRIDHVFLHGMKARDYRLVDTRPHSDHKAVAVRLAFPFH